MRTASKNDLAVIWVIFVLRRQASQGGKLHQNRVIAFADQGDATIRA